MGFHRVVSGEKSRLSLSEFKYIITRYSIYEKTAYGPRFIRRIRKKDWWKILKELENANIVRLAKNKRYINILMNGMSIQKFVINKNLKT